MMKKNMILCPSLPSLPLNNRAIGNFKKNGHVNYGCAYQLEFPFKTTLHRT